MKQLPIGRQKRPWQPQKFLNKQKKLFKILKVWGATNLPFVKTDANAARTMKCDDEEIASFAIEVVGGSLTDVKFVASAKGTVLGDFN